MPANQTSFKEGNTFWQRAKELGTIGRNRKFDDPEQLKAGIDQYFEETDKKFWYKEDFIKSGPEAGKIIKLKTSTPYTIQGLCESLGVHSQYFNDFEQSLKNMEDRQKAAEFSVIIAHAKEKISRQKIEGAMVGAFNPMIVARIEGLKDKQDITSNDKDIQGIASITITREDYKASSKELDKEV